MEITLSRFHNRNFELLEPYEGKLSCTVLRGEGSRKGADLPGWKGNINQMIEIDSVRCDFDKYPYNVRTFARQVILRESSVTERSLVTRCRLLDAVRSDNNPQGFIIEGFEIIENRDLQTIKR